MSHRSNRKLLNCCTSCARSSAIDAGLADALECLDSASIQLREASNACADYAARIDLDPERLAQLERRISQVFGTARRMKLAPESLSDELTQTEQRLAQLAGSGEHRIVARTRRQCRTSVHASGEAPEHPTAKNRRQVSQAVTRHLQQLGMKGSTFQIAIETAPPDPIRH